MGRIGRQAGKRLWKLAGRIARHKKIPPAGGIFERTQKLWL